MLRALFRFLHSNTFFFYLVCNYLVCNILGALGGSKLLLTLSLVQSIIDARSRVYAALKKNLELSFGTASSSAHFPHDKVPAAKRGKHGDVSM